MTRLPLSKALRRWRQRKSLAEGVSFLTRKVSGARAYGRVVHIACQAGSMLNGSRIVLIFQWLWTGVDCLRSRRRLCTWRLCGVLQDREVTKTMAAANGARRSANVGDNCYRRRSLNSPGKKCTTSKPSTLAVSVRTLDVEPARGSKDAALRLICRAMIRLYLRDCGDPTDGERLGVL